MSDEFERMIALYRQARLDLMEARSGVLRHHLIEKLRQQVAGLQYENRRLRERLDDLVFSVSPDMPTPDERKRMLKRASYHAWWIRNRADPAWLAAYQARKRADYAKRKEQQV